MEEGYQESQMERATIVLKGNLIEVLALRTDPKSEIIKTPRSYRLGISRRQVVNFVGLHYNI